MYFLLLTALLYCFNAASMDNEFPNGNKDFLKTTSEILNNLEENLQKLDNNLDKNEDDSEINDLLSNIDENEEAQSEYLKGIERRLNSLSFHTTILNTKFNKIKQNNNIARQLKTITQALKQQKTDADKKIVELAKQLTMRNKEDKEILTTMKNSTSRTQNIVLGAVAIGIGLYIFNALMPRQPSTTTNFAADSLNFQARSEIG